MTVRTSPAGHSLSRRTALVAAGAGTATLLLAACREEPIRVEAGQVVATEDISTLALPDLTPQRDEVASGLELPGIRYRVEELAIMPGLPRSTAEKLSLVDGVKGEENSRNGDDEPEPEVLAPEGQVFLLATLTAVNPQLMAADRLDPDERIERLVINGKPQDPWVRPMEPGGRISVVTTVPEEPGPEAAMLEVTCGEAVQRLSLVDGSLAASDLEHYYRQRYAVHPDRLWWERFGDENADGGPMLGGAVTAVTVEPVLDDGTWPQPGNLLLGVELAALPATPGAEDLSTLTLLLPDGAEATAHGETTRAFRDPRDGGGPAWFEVPHDVTAATLRVNLAARTAAGTEPDLGAEEVSLKIVATDR